MLVGHVVIPGGVVVGESSRVGNDGADRVDSGQRRRHDHPFCCFTCVLLFIPTSASHGEWNVKHVLNKDKYERYMTGKYPLHGMSNRIAMQSLESRQGRVMTDQIKE